MKPFRIALCQITPSFDKDRNIERACSMVSEAANRGAQVVALPEMFFFPFELGRLKAIADRDESTINRFREIASRHGIFLCTGSIALAHDGRIFNTSFLLGKSGETLLEYSKIHLFDVNFKGLRVTESSVFEAGASVSVVETDLCTMGIMVCYDVRFPEVAREIALRGAELILVPAVFNRITGPAHWHIMMQARAIENQVFLAAISQGRNDESSYKAYGHSLVSSPWGDLLTEAGEDEQIVYADLKPAVLEETRSRLPLLHHRRSDLYDGWRDPLAD